MISDSFYGGVMTTIMIMAAANRKNLSFPRIWYLNDPTKKPSQIADMQKTQKSTSALIALISYRKNIISGYLTAGRSRLKVMF